MKGTPYNGPVPGGSKHCDQVAPARQNIYGQVTQLEDAVSELHSRLEVLQDTLNGVLQPVEAVPVGTQKEAEFYGSPMNARLDTLNKGIYAAVYRIQNILNRIDL
jgi:hypothetical protein